MDVIEEDKIIGENDSDWGKFGEDSTFDDLSDDFDWPDAAEWGDIDFDFSDNYSNNSSNYNDSLYELEGYGTIYELEQLNNSEGLVEILEHAKSDEQFNYILGMSKEESHDDRLLQYLISKDYTIEQYLSIKISYKMFKFKPLFMYFFNKATDEEKYLLVEKVKFMTEEIAEFIANHLPDFSNQTNSEIRFACHLDNELVIQKIIDLYKKQPEKVNFDFVPLSRLSTGLIRQIIDLGYVIDENSPYDIMKNNEIMKEQFLKKTSIKNSFFLEEIDRAIVDNSGAYGKLFCIKNLELYDDNVIEILGTEYFWQILKYILLSDYEINLTKIISDGKLGFIKTIYDELSNTQDFDIKLFINIVSKYNLNDKFMVSIGEKEFNEYKDEFKFLFEHKDINVANLDELKDIKTIFYRNMENKIGNANTALDLKNIITYLLTSQTYFETRKGNCEIWSREKLKVLKNSIKNPKVQKRVDSYLIFSDFFESFDILNDVNYLRILANTINRKCLQKGFNSTWTNLNDKVMDLYNYELNERMTNFNNYLIESTYEATDQIFLDGVNVKGKRVRVAHIKSGEEYNSLIHVLNAYQNSDTKGAVESIKHPILVGQSYICLSGISDEYNRICINGNSMTNPKYNLKILYSHVPKGNMFYASNRDTGINSCSNSKDITTRLPKNMMPFRRLVRNTEVHGSEAYNEIDVYRDNLVPSGIAFMGNFPTEEEINIAAYLDVPVVKIDDLQETFKKDTLISRVIPDSEFYNIKEHSYEEKEVFVTSNDSFDEMLSFLKAEIDKKEKTDYVDLLEALEVKDETGSYDYIVSIMGTQYEAMPLYDYIDSKRRNVSKINVEKKLVKYKLSTMLGTDSREKFGYCEYPNGKIIFSSLVKSDSKNDIDKCIDYLVGGEDVDDDLSLNCREYLSKLLDVSEEEYLALFNSLYLVSDYTEAKTFYSTILSRREKILTMLMSNNLNDMLDMEIPKLKEEKVKIDMDVEGVSLK